MMSARHLRNIACALVACVVVGAPAARADILDAEDWSNHVEEINQINNTQQFRRTMNRGFDMMAGMGGGGDAGAPSAAQQMASWTATLVVPSAAPSSEMQQFLKTVAPSGRDEIASYVKREFDAYPAAAAKASFNPWNVADARLFALETAFRAIHPHDPMPFAATFLLDIALSQQMTSVYTARQLSTREKQDTLDYYIIARALFLPAVPDTPEHTLADDSARHTLAAAAQSFFIRDTGVDPTTVTWQQLPCLGASPVDCAAHLVMARSAMAGAR